jgi:hypothetical protein
MSQAAQLVASLGRLLGGKIALLPFGDFEERFRSAFGSPTHYMNIQASCINVQRDFREHLSTTGSRNPMKSWLFHRNCELLPCLNGRHGGDFFPDSTTSH